MDVPPSPTAEEKAQFYAAVGRAITDWANLEKELFEITAAILGCAKRHSAIVFYRTPTIDSRLTLTNDLVESIFPAHAPGEHPSPTLKEWRRLQSDIKTKLKIRNWLAHHPIDQIVDIYESKDGQEHKIEIRPASYISHTAHLRSPKESPQILVLTKVQDHIKVVSGLVDRLRRFIPKLSEQLQAHVE